MPDGGPRPQGPPPLPPAQVTKEDQMIEEGAEAPDFTLPNQDGEDVAGSLKP